MPLALDMTFCSVCRVLAGRESVDRPIDYGSSLIKFYWAKSDLDQTGDSVLAFSTTFTTWQSASRDQPSQASDPPESSPQPARGNKHCV